MRCAKLDCSWGDLSETSPCSVCGRPVHHLCSNELCTKADLSKPHDCVVKFFGAESDSQELTPSSTPGISQSSTSTVVDLAQREDDDEEEEKEPEVTTISIPNHIVHAPPVNSTDPIWTLIHQLGEEVTYKSKAFTHICLLCAETKAWRDSLCRATNSTNAKTHLVASHKDHPVAIQEQQRRLKRGDRYMVQLDTRTDVKRQASSESKALEEKPINTSESHTDYILEETKALLREEHRVFYKGLYANVDQEDGCVASASSSPQGECNSCSDTEGDSVYGEEVSQPAEESTADATLNAKADAVLDEWLSLRVEWAEVAKKQYTSKDEFERVLAKLSLRDRKRNVRVWNVEQLCGHIDVCRWFTEVGEEKYPSIAKLARVWMGRGSSTAFQERVFSTGSFVMSSLRTRTDNERAQRQLILRHNRLELRRLEESKRQMW